LKKGILFLILLLPIVIISGCRTRPQILVKPAYDRPLPTGAQALRKITNPLEIPDFTVAGIQLEGLSESISNSLNYLSKPSSRQFFPSNGITHDKAVLSLKAFAEMLDSGLQGAALDAAIRENFDVYMSIGCDDRGTVLFTGYYTPILDGSLAGGSDFLYPLYEAPSDLVKGPEGQILGRRSAAGSLDRYPPRTVIESSGMMAGSELVWLKDPFEVYVAHVQGSAKIRLPDGKIIGAGYSANNGWEYESIVDKMADDGAINKAAISLSAMINYFKLNPDKVAKYTGINPRFVFFQRDDGPPRGSINEPVLPLRSIATDKTIFPRASLTFISTVLPKEDAGSIREGYYDGFALDQDTGGAIRAPGRCDIYMGVGNTAGKLAGRTYREGRLYYLFLK
jgi:membrane-bound lytic murein transglycosylase A